MRVHRGIGASLVFLLCAWFEPSQPNHQHWHRLPHFVPQLAAAPDSSRRHRLTRWGRKLRSGRPVATLRGTCPSLLKPREGAPSDAACGLLETSSSSWAVGGDFAGDRVPLEG
jgi:hypothetical protein